MDFGIFRQKPVSTCEAFWWQTWSSASSKTLLLWCECLVRQEQELRNGNAMDKKLSTLADLFRPPIELLHKGSFETVSSTTAFSGPISITSNTFSYRLIRVLQSSVSLSTKFVSIIMCFVPGQEQVKPCKSRSVQTLIQAVESLSLGKNRNQAGWHQFLKKCSWFSPFDSICDWCAFRYCRK